MTQARDEARVELSCHTPLTSPPAQKALPPAPRSTMHFTASSLEAVRNAWYTHARGGTGTHARTQMNHLYVLDALTDA
eukprot:2149707-Pleurochrysis_carterae.AAC.1